MDQKKILIIDDEPEVATLLKLRLEAQGYEVLTATDGQDGMDKIKKDKPDLVLLDVAMPKMDGYTFLQEFKKVTDLKETPVIVLTAKGEMKDIFTMEGIQDYIVKPFDAVKLLEKIKSYLQ